MAASVLEVLINGDSSGLTKALDQAGASAKGFEQTAGGAANAATTKMGGAFQAIGQTLKTVAPALIAVGAAAVAGIGKGIQATQQWASDTRSLIRITGQTAEGASTLLAASQLLGIGVDKLSTGFGILSKNIVNGSPALDKYGISVRDVHGDLLPFDDILGAVSDKFLELPAGPEQAAFAMNVFGRSGKDLIPILAKGSDGMEELRAKAAELGLVMSTDDLDASKALASAQRELGLAFKGAAISLGKLFIPALTKVVGFGTKVLEFFTHLPNPVKEVGVGLALAAGAVGTLTVAFTGLKATFGPVVEGITNIGKALFESGLFSNAGTALSAASSGAQALGASVEKASEQIQQGSDGASTALQAVSDAATGTSAAVSVAVAKEGGVFAGLGAKVASGLSGIGSALASVATGPIGIIVAIAAAVALLTVVVIKNWDTIKTWGAGLEGVFNSIVLPIIDGIRGAFAEIGPALQDLGRSLGDLGTAIGEALAPILPILEPIVKVLGVIGAGLLLSPLLGLLKAIEIGFQALGSVIRFTGTAVAAAAKFIIDAVNAVIHRINEVIIASNKWLHTHFDLIPEVEQLGTSADATASAVGGLADAADKAAKANEHAKTATGALRAAIQGARPLLDAMGTSYDTLAAGAKTAFDTAVTAGADTTAALQTFADQQVAAAQEARNAFMEQARSALTFSTSMLSTLEQTAQEASDTLAGDTSSLDNSQLAALRDQANLTASDILHTFQSAADQSRSFGRDLLELSRIGGRAGKDLAASLLESGDVLAAQIAADAPRKMQNQIVTAFGKSESAADTFSSKLTDAIVGPLEDIRGLLVQLAKKVFGVTLTYNDNGAGGKVTHLESQLERLNDKHFQAFVDVHTQPKSPWPDEALKMHLTDPITKMGFHRIAGRWTLPLDITAHTGHIDAANRMLSGEAAAPPAWYAAATKPIDVPSTAHMRRRSRQPKVVIDRKRFADELAIEVDYRGY